MPPLMGAEGPFSNLVGVTSMNDARFALRKLQTQHPIASRNKTFGARRQRFTRQTHIRDLRCWPPYGASNEPLRVNEQAPRRRWCESVDYVDSQAGLCSP